MTNDVTNPTTGTPAKRDRSAEISPKLRVCLDAMIERGLELQDAAKEGGMTSRGLRLSLSRLAVKTYLKRARAEFISSIRASNPKRLRELRDQESNPAAAVRAAVAIEQLAEQEERDGVAHRWEPGITIIIGAAPDRPAQIVGGPKTIEGRPSASQAESVIDENDDAAGE